MQHIKSAKFFELSKTCIPGGVNSPVRAYAAVNATPVFVKQAKGDKIIDEDGNEYIDYVNSWGPCILGHANDTVIEAVKSACDDGLSFGAPTQKEYELAQLIREAVPSMQVSRLVSSGTEAVMSAIRVARGYTRRDKIMKFRGCYHGHCDSLLVKAGSGAMTQSVPDSAGIPADFTKHTLVAEYNDETSVEALFRENEDTIAAVIVEPVAANMGVIPPNPGFLAFLRRITKQYGALLIFDEVITGFRLSFGGAQAYYGITPDMTTLGKIIGGGMPVGAYGGRRDIMQLVSPVGPVYQAGTLSGNPLATAAGIATLRQLKDHPEIYEELEKKTNYLATAAKEKFGDSVCVRCAGSLMSIFFTKEKVENYAGASSSDTARFSEFFHYMLDNGIYLAPSQFESMFVSAAHSWEDIEKTVQILSEFKG